MAPLGPWDPARRIAVAVSGGPDSLCAALLAKRWGDPLALIVDHGLRPESAREAAWTAVALSTHAIPSQTLRLRTLLPGPALAARARHARYAILAAACRDAGLVDLMLGHHAGDQAETVLMRQRRGSGEAGLSGMAALSEHSAIRLLRPLLAQPGGVLRATLHALGQHDWIDDPSNRDLTSARARARRDLAAGTPPAGRTPATARASAEAAATAQLAELATILPEGWVVLRPTPLSPLALGMLLRAVGGGVYPASPAALAALARSMRPATLAGVRIVPAGRHGPGWLLVREPAAMARPVPVADGTVWDGRFRIAGTMPGHTVGALGSDAARLRHLSHWPSAALQTLPAIRRINELSVVPHLSYGRHAIDAGRVALLRAAPPACGGGFVGVD